MSQQDLEQLKHDLKAMVVEECDKDMPPEDISDDEILIGGPMELDSLDALQICMAVQQTYGVRIEAGARARKALRSINTLADIIQQERTR